jgi:hypothetical protein
MRRSHWIILGLLAAGFLFTDLELRQARERGKRVKHEERIRKLAISQRGIDHRLNQNARTLARIGKRLYFSGGAGEIVGLPWPVDPALIPVAGSAQRRLADIRARIASAEQAPPRASAGKRGPREEESESSADEPALALTPEEEIRPAATQLLDGDLSWEAFATLMEPVLLWGDLGEARVLLEEVSRKSGDAPEVLYYLSQVAILEVHAALGAAYRESALERAASLLEGVVGRGEDHRWARLQLGWCAALLPLSAGRTARGIELLEQVSTSADYAPEDRGRAAMVLAESLVTLGDRERARDALRAARDGGATARGLAELLALLGG